MDESLQDLVRRFTRGDESAFAPLAEQVARIVYPRTLKAVGNHETADDITQEVLLRVYRRVGEIGDVKAFEGWIHRIAFNLIHDHYRRRTRERQLRQGFTEYQAQVRASRISARERQELAEILRGALEVLDEKHREVFILKEVEEHSHEQIAELLGIPEGTVWSRLSYARRALRERLQRRPEGLELPSER